MSESIQVVWEIHEHFEFTLIPVVNNPYGTGHISDERYEVTDEQGRKIGRITNYGRQGWAAYSHALWDDLSSRIGFYHSKEKACRKLLDAWDRYVDDPEIGLAYGRDD